MNQIKSYISILAFVALSFFAFASLLGQNTAPIPDEFTIKKLDAANSGGDLVESWGENGFSRDTVEYDLSIRADSISPTSATLDISLIWNGAKFSETITINSTAELWWPVDTSGLAAAGIPAESLFQFTWTNPPGTGEKFTATNKDFVGPLYDKDTYSQNVVLTAHGEIHKKRTWEIGYAATFSLNDTFFIAFDMPIGALEAHVQAYVTTSGGAQYNWIQGDTLSGGADTTDILNVHFGARGTSGMDAVYLDAVVSETGTERVTHKLGAGNNRGGESRDLGEYVFEGGQAVDIGNVLRFVSNANTNVCTIIVRWYEPENP